jgi:rhomboid protease GluP
VTTNPPPSSPGPPPAGAGSPPPAWQPEGAPEGGGFLDTLKEGRVSYAFIAAAAIIFYLSVAGDFSLRQGVSQELAEKYGAFSYRLVRDQGEWWRYITTLFVSRYGLDLVIFAFIFIQAGPRIERALGSLRFAILYLFAGAGGVALAEVIDPGAHQGQGMGDTIVACYAAWGALPGVVLGMTRSLRKTLQSAEAQSAALSIAFWTFLRYYMTGNLEWSVLGAAILGMLLAAGLTISRGDARTGALATAAPLLVIALLIGLAASGKRWLDGRLTDRGVPARRGLPGPQDPTSTERPASVLDSPESSNKEALRAKVGPFLRKFGPLPSNEGTTIDDKEQARTLLAEVDKVANGTNAVLGELDPERIKLNILLYNTHAASRLARDYMKLAPPASRAYARALAGLTAFQLGKPEDAETHLETAVRDEAFVLEMPEALYHYARVLEEQHGIDVAHSHYERYARMVSDGRHPPWRQRLVDDAKAKTRR